MAFKPKHDDFGDLMLEYHTTYELDRLVDLLVYYHLQDAEYPSNFDFRNQCECKRERLKILLLTKKVEKQFSITDETVFKYYSLNEYSDETVIKPVTCPCVNLSEFAAWAIKEKFPCPQIILDKAAVPPGSNQNIGKTEPDDTESSPDIIDQAAKGHENTGMVQQPEIAHDHEAPAVKTKSKGREPSNFTKLVTHVFNKLPELNKLNLAKQSKTREFIVLMKEMATHNSRLADSYVVDAVKSITIPDEGLCTITMDDDSKLFGDNELRRKGRKYNNHNVSQVLSRLRKD